MFMSECVGISALTHWLEYSEWFVIVLLALLEVWREACAYRYGHEHLLFANLHLTSDIKYTNGNRLYQCYRTA